MKRIGEIMEEMGFNKQGSEEAKKAFVKYLLRVSNGIEVVEKKEVQPAEQLSFSFVHEVQSGDKTA
ncbi:MAG: hypothetical protein N2578_05020 [Bdellovibrionaceae bacterium]|nr:hypothetical protein [Pseudobdellovibrionaceae bacterium]